MPSISVLGIAVWTASEKPHGFANLLPQFFRFGLVTISKFSDAQFDLG